MILASLFFLMHGKFVTSAPESLNHRQQWQHIREPEQQLCMAVTLPLVHSSVSSSRAWRERPESSKLQLWKRWKRTRIHIHRWWRACVLPSVCRTFECVSNGIWCDSRFLNGHSFVVTADCCIVCDEAGCGTGWRHTSRSGRWHLTVLHALVCVCKTIGLRRVYTTLRFEYCTFEKRVEMNHAQKIIIKRY